MRAGPQRRRRLLPTAACRARGDRCTEGAPPPFVAHRGSAPPRPVAAETSSDQGQRAGRQLQFQLYSPSFSTVRVPAIESVHRRSGR